MPVLSRPDLAQGIFETMLVVDGRPVELGAHMARLEASLGELFDGRPSEVYKEIENHAEGISLGSVRVTVAPTGAAALRAKIEAREPALGAFMPVCGKKSPMQTVAVHSFDLPGGLGAHKWADRHMLDEAQAELDADTLPLIVDTDGTVLEASRANIFVVRDETLATPPLNGRILPGITRARVQELAAALGIETREAKLSREDLYAADEVFLTGSVRGIERVDALDGAQLATRSEIGSRIADELRRSINGVDR